MAHLAGLLHLSATDDGTQFTGTYGVNIGSAKPGERVADRHGPRRLARLARYRRRRFAIQSENSPAISISTGRSRAQSLRGGLNANTLGSLTNVGFDDVSIDVGSFFGSYLAAW